MTTSEVQQSAATKRLLICADWFAPGVRAGGPIRSCVNLTRMLGRSVRTVVLTSERDLGCTSAYSEIATNRWVNWNGKAAVKYCGGPLRRMAEFVRLCKRHQPDAIYLNSMFSVAGTLWPLLYLWLSRSPVRVVLAPRGMLKPSAMNHKGWKKRPLVNLLKWLRITRRVHFHATSKDEAQEIRNALGNVSTELIPNVPCIPANDLPAHYKEEDVVKLCFIGRIHPIKNLLWLIETMAEVRSLCSMTVIGPIEQEHYYNQCLRAVERLPGNVSVTFEGVKSETEIGDTLKQSDALILPTLGENFGHAIFEALATGTPVIVSDQTTWRDLASQYAGWDLSLDRPADFVVTIDGVAKMDDSQFQCWRSGALNVAQNFLLENDFLRQYQTLFFTVCPPASKGARVGT